MQKVKIISGWSAPGGSTVAHINLCNLLNDNGFDCTFYGPHDWHLDKCKAARTSEMHTDDDDIVISHFINPVRMNCKQILYCHEHEIYPLRKIDISVFDSIVCVSNKQKAWHAVNHPCSIIPPIVKKINWIKPEKRAAGVIGSVDPNKQTHISIQSALDDGHDKVYLFGQVTDMQYFNEYVAKYINTGKAVMVGHVDNNDEMYSMVSDVYHSSLRETYGLVEAECKAAGVPYRGIENNPEILTDEEILERWKTVLQ
jgi:hypothetical protein